jgi:hypothetical protein
MSLWKSSIDHSLADVAQAGAFSAEGEAFLKPGGLMGAWESRLDDFESLSAEESGSHLRALRASARAIG